MHHQKGGCAEAGEGMLGSTPVAVTGDTLSVVPPSHLEQTLYDSRHRRQFKENECNCSGGCECELNVPRERRDAHDPIVQDDILIDSEKAPWTTFSRPVVLGESLIALTGTAMIASMTTSKNAVGPRKDGTESP
jgi:hypothetical protein